MAAKNAPSEFDCYDKALPDEPMFILLARDPEFCDLITKWARRRRNAIRCGERPQSDYLMVREAEQCAVTGALWRQENLGKWRSKS